MFKKSLLLFSLVCCITGAQAEVCSEGAQPSRINPKYCCKGPFLEGDFNGKPIYDFFQPSICGCPDGGEFKGRSCCKNGYAYGENYALETSDSLHRDADLSKGKYAFMNAESCGCPDGLEEKNGVCCNNGWIGDDYNPWKCGCPDGGEMDPRDHVCKKNHYSYYYAKKQYAGLSPQEDGCPDEAKEVKDIIGRVICCKDNLTYDDNTSSWTKADSRCGCPDGGEASPNGGKSYTSVYPCCKDGFMYNSETGKYDKVNNHYCRPEAYQISKEELDKYKNDPEAFFKYWQENHDQFKKKAQEKKSESPYYYERDQK